MRGVFQDMLLYGGFLLARAAGESAGGTFLAGEAVASETPPFWLNSLLTTYLHYCALTVSFLRIMIPCSHPPLVPTPKGDPVCSCGSESSRFCSLRREHLGVLQRFDYLP